MRRLSWILLLTLILVGCSEEITKEVIVKEKEEQTPYGLNGNTYRNQRFVFKVSKLPVDEWSIYVDDHPFIKDSTMMYSENDQSKNNALVILEAYFPKGEYIILSELSTDEIEALNEEELESATARLEIMIETQVGMDVRSANDFAKVWMEQRPENQYDEQGIIRTKDSYAGYKFYYVSPNGNKGGIAYFMRSKGNTKRIYRISYWAEGYDAGREAFDRLLDNLEFNTL